MIGRPRPAIVGVQDGIDHYWSTYASDYDAHQMRRLTLPDESGVWRQVWSAVLPQAPATVLDVGTGTGHAALTVAGLGHRVVGVDHAAGMLAIARRKPHRTRRPPRFVRGDGARPPFAPASFDAVVARYALWTLRFPDQALANWYRVLRPGGTVAIVEGLWFPDGLLRSPHAAETGTRTRDFRAAYAPALADLPLAEATDIGVFADLVAAAGFLEVTVAELPAVLDLDRRHGVAPDHRLQMNYRITARRP